jgi:Matrixin
MAVPANIVQNAWLLSPNPTGAIPGLVINRPGAMIVMKARLSAGHTYVVSTNSVPGDLVIFGPNGNPLNPGVGAKAMPVTPPADGTYFIGFTANPQMVAAGTPFNIVVQDFGHITPTDLTGALTPGFGGDPVQWAIDIALGKQPTGQPVTTFTLHRPDGLAFATGAPVSGDANETVPSTAPTPLETGDDGKPLTWVGSNDAPGNGHLVTWSLATGNYQDDSGNLQFSHSMGAAFEKLVQEAAGIWQSVADITFKEVGDDAVAGPQRPDLRIGFADLQTSLQHPTLGFTQYGYTANDKFLPDTLIGIEDPTKGEPAIQLANGDFRYQDFDATMLQTLLHEIGHSLGLAHNSSDPNSIMNPTLTASNRLPDANDIKALQSLYGAPKTPNVAAAVGDLIHSV